MTIGESIKWYRNNKKMTQKQLAKMSGLAEITIRQYENGKRQPRIEQLEKIANILNVGIQDLISSDSEQTNLFGTELLSMDYGLIETLANHKIFSDKERKMIFEKIEECRTTLSKINDIDTLEKYSEKTHCDLENILLKIILDKHKNDISDIIVVLSCFFSLKNQDQYNLTGMLLNYCYPNIDLKYSEP